MAEIAGIVMHCLQCEQPGRADQKFCTRCGSALVILTPCSTCGASVAPLARFCSRCGTARDAHRQPTPPAPRLPSATPMAVTSETSRRQWLTVGLCVTGVVLLAYVFQLSRRPSPRQALEGAVWAFENRNMAVFERHVDIEGITGDVIDQLIDNAVRVNMADSTEFNRTITAGMLKGVGDAIKPSLAPALRGVAEKLVTGSAWREITPRSNNASGAMFEAATYQVVRELLLALRHYQGVSHESRSGLSSGRVVTFFVPPRTGTKVQMELEVRFINGHWRIVRLPDVGRMLKSMSAR